MGWNRAALALILMAGGAGAQTVYIGTQSEALWAAKLDPKTGSLSAPQQAAQVARPTWLAMDAPQARLFAVSETGTDRTEQGGVVSYAIEGGKLRPLSRVVSGGSGPTFLSHDPRSNTLFVGNFWGGEVVAVPVDRAGRLGPFSSLVRDTGMGVGPKQNMPHAHATALDPSGHFLLVPDMGADRVFIYRFEPGARVLRPAATPYFQSDRGSGPRHIAFGRAKGHGGRFAYLVTELTAQLRVLQWDAKAGRLTQIQAEALDPPGTPADQKSAAEVAVSPDGHFVYVSNRIRNTIVAFALNPRSGRARKVGEYDTRGMRPRSFGIDPTGRWMIVGNQESQAMQVMAIDRRTGALTPTGAPVPIAAKPVAFAFYP